MSDSDLSDLEAFAVKNQSSQPCLKGKVLAMLRPAGKLACFQACKLSSGARAGPWKGLWVQRGYDPRTDPSAARRQAVEVPRRCSVRLYLEDVDPCGHQNRLSGLGDGLFNAFCIPYTLLLLQAFPLHSSAQPGSQIWSQSLIAHV